MVLTNPIANFLFGSQALPVSFGIALGFKEGVLILLFSFFAGFLLRYLFFSYSNSFSSRSNFGNSILLVTISVASLIAVVKSSLALSLGLVGALSVVRFRTAVKEPFNLSYILLSICIGISIGASQYLFALMLLVVGSLTIIYIYKRGIESGNKDETQPILDSISLTMPYSSNISELLILLDKFCESYNIKSINSRKDDETRISFNVNIIKHSDLNDLINEIKAQEIYKEIAFYNSPQY